MFLQEGSVSPGQQGLQTLPGCFMLWAMKKRKKKPKHKKNESPIGLAWYSREQWELLKQAADDADGMDDTFSQWERNAQNAHRVLRQSGYAVEIVDVDVAELLGWCKSQRRPLDGEARSEFVLEKLQENRHPGRSRQKDPAKNSPKDPEENQ
jgi:hypothetical protein